MSKLPKSRAGSNCTIASFVTFDVFPGVKPNKGEPIMAFSGVFTPVLVRHSKSFSHIDCISVGVDRMEPNFKPMRKQVEAWLTKWYGYVANLKPAAKRLQSQGLN